MFPFLLFQLLVLCSFVASLALCGGKKIKEQTAPASKNTGIGTPPNADGLATAKAVGTDAAASANKSDRISLDGPEIKTDTSVSAEQVDGDARVPSAEGLNMAKAAPGKLLASEKCIRGNRLGEPPIKLELNPKDVLYMRWSKRCTYVDFEMSNPFSEHHLYKVKVSDRMFRVRRPMGVIAPNETIEIRLIQHFLDRPLADTHYVTIVHISCTDLEAKKFEEDKVWPEGRRLEGIWRLPVVFYEGRRTRPVRIPSEYSFEGLNPAYKQQQYAQESEGGRTLAAPITVVLDANNNAPLPPRSPARGYSAQQKGYGSGAQAESAYIAIPNDLVYAQNNAQWAYTNYGQESRPAYASNSRTNQASSTRQLKPEAARELYAALSSENVRTALERDAPILEQAPAYSAYNGQRVQGRAFVIPAQQKYSEYNVDDLNNLRSVIDR